MGLVAFISQQLIRRNQLCLVSQISLLGLGWKSRILCLRDFKGWEPSVVRVTLERCSHSRASNPPHQQPASSKTSP